MSLYDQLYLDAEWRARAQPSTPPIESNAVMETPEETRQLIGSLARGLGAYARGEHMSEHDHRLALEAEIRRETAR